eukprot:g55376.t1
MPIMPCGTDGSESAHLKHQIFCVPLFRFSMYTSSCKSECSHISFKLQAFRGICKKSRSSARAILCEKIFPVHCSSIPFSLTMIFVPLPITFNTLRHVFLVREPHLKSVGIKAVILASSACGLSLQQLSSSFIPKTGGNVATAAAGLVRAAPEQSRRVG